MNNTPFHSSLATKFALPICGFTVIALLIGGYILLDVAKNSTDQQIAIAQSALQSERNAAQERAYQRLMSKADIIGEFLAKTAPPLINASDFTTIHEYQKLASADADIRYSTYLNSDGNPLLDATTPRDKTKVMEKPMKLNKLVRYWVQWY